MSWKMHRFRGSYLVSFLVFTVSCIVCLRLGTSTSNSPVSYGTLHHLLVYNATANDRTANNLAVHVMMVRYTLIL